MDICVIRKEGEISPVFHDVTNLEFSHGEHNGEMVNTLNIFSCVEGVQLKAVICSAVKIQVEEYHPTMGEIFKGLWSELKEFGCIIWGWIKNIPNKCTGRRFK